MLYRNRRAPPGLRVLLNGSTHNPQAIGARVRLVFSDGRLGAVHELKAGAGYWSQDSMGLVLGAAEQAVSVEIVWPGGRSQRIPIPSGARELTARDPAVP